MVTHHYIALQTKWTEKSHIKQFVVINISILSSHKHLEPVEIDCHERKSILVTQTIAEVWNLHGIDRLRFCFSCQYHVSIGKPWNNQQINKINYSGQLSYIVNMIITNNQNSLKTKVPELDSDGVYRAYWRGYWVGCHIGILHIVYRGLMNMHLFVNIILSRQNRYLLICEKLYY